MRGVKGVGAEVRKRLSEVGLLGAAKRPSGTFSGGACEWRWQHERACHHRRALQCSRVLYARPTGMKRRLSVAIAFCGSPRIVFLDEPTTGMVHM